MPSIGNQCLCLEYVGHQFYGLMVRELTMEAYHYTFQ